MVDVAARSISRRTRHGAQCSGPCTPKQRSASPFPPFLSSPPFFLPECPLFLPLHNIPIPAWQSFASPGSLFFSFSSLDLGFGPRCAVFLEQLWIQRDRFHQVCRTISLVAERVMTSAAHPEGARVTGTQADCFRKVC